jgi:hypothetical protein
MMLLRMRSRPSPQAPRTRDRREWSCGKTCQPGDDTPSSRRFYAWQPLQACGGPDSLFGGTTTCGARAGAGQRQRAMGAAEEISVLGIGAKSRLKKAVCIATAYLLAFQLVLAGALAAQMAFTPGEAQANCHSIAADDVTDGQTGPIHSDDDHAVCSICAFTSCVPTLSGAPSAAFTRQPQTTAHFTATWAAPSAVDRHEPRSSQGPPLRA